MSRIGSYFYQGDYEDLLDWIIKAYNPIAYTREGFFAWLKDVKQDFAQSGHHFSDDIKDEMRTFWQDNGFGKLGTPEEDSRKVKRAKTYNTVREQAVFTLKDAYQFNESRPKASIRRELQELVKEGKLERISKGVYRVA